jgi:hypothetical protein
MSKAVPIQQDTPLFDMSKAVPIEGQQFDQSPEAVAARHARSTEGKNLPPFKGYEEPGLLERLATGVGKEGTKTIQGIEGLANTVLRNVGPIAGPGQAPPQLPIMGENLDTSLHGVAEHVGGIAEQAVEWAAGEKGLKAISTVAKAPHAVLELLEKYPRASKIITTALQAGTIGGTQGAVKGKAEGDTASGAEGGAAGGLIGGAAAEVTGPALGWLGKTLGVSGMSAEQLFTKAGRPSVNEAQKFVQALDTAGPRIAEAAKDVKLKTVGDFENLLHDAAQSIRTNEFQPMVDRHATEALAGKSIGDNIRSAVTSQMEEYAPEEAQTIKDFATKFDKDIPLAKAEQDLQYFNAQLKKFYRTSAVDQNAALQVAPTIAKYEAAADGLRDSIYGKLRELGENAPELLQRQYGALKTLERTVAKRATVADRQAPLNLSQVLSLAGGGLEGATALLTGHPLAAAAGVIPIAISTAAKIRNAPEALIRRGVAALAPSVPSTVGQAAGEVARQGAGFVGAQVGQAVAPKTPGLPPLPPGMLRFKDSVHGSIHDIPRESLDQAKKIDPNLQIVEGEE